MSSHKKRLIQMQESENQLAARFGRQPRQFLSAAGQGEDCGNGFYLQDKPRFFAAGVDAILGEGKSQKRATGAR